MKNSLLTFVVLVLGSLLSPSAYALFTACTLNYETKSKALGFEFGDGVGFVECVDIRGNEVDPIAVDVGLFGFGIKSGTCETSGQIKAVGIGFSLDEFLSLLIQAEIGSMLIDGETVGIGMRASLGSNLTVTASKMKYEGRGCVGIGSIQGLVVSKLQ